jgi:PadR family transcriptional regulator PadR
LLLDDIRGNIIYNSDYMARKQSLGELEQLVLLAILRLRDAAYGVSIRSEIEARTGRKTTRGALYATLDRLEEKEFVTSRMGDPTPIRGGRAKRYYTVSAHGVRAIAQSQYAYRRMLDGLAIPGARHA